MNDLSLPVSPLNFPVDLGGYQILRYLPGGNSALASARGSREIVIKPLDPDCLLRSKNQSTLHPSIYDRLSRVRELPHGYVANFYGVERDQGHVFLIWQYVEGMTLGEWIATPDKTEDEILIALREIIANLQSLHHRGIVHGAVHPRNIIMGSDDRIRLTHINPLLYTDPAQDIAALQEMLLVWTSVECLVT